MIISEATGLFMIPYSIWLSGNAWELMNKTGIVYIPFIAAILVSVMESRSMGRDSGGAPELSLKFMEKRFIGMFAVIIFCIIPWPGSNVYKFQAYSCSQYLQLFSGVNGVNQALPWGGSTMPGVSNSKPPMAIALAHNVGTVMSNALISASGCEQDMDYAAITADQMDLMPEDESLYNSISNFTRQCYYIARKRIQDAHLNGFTFYHPYSPDTLSWQDPIIFDAYGSNYISSVPIGTTAPDEQPLYFVGSETDIAPLKTSMSCQDAKHELVNAINGDLSANHDPKKTASIEFTSSFGGIGGASGVNVHIYTQRELQNRFFYNVLYYNDRFAAPQFSVVENYRNKKDEPSNSESDWINNTIAFFSGYQLTKDNIALSIKSVAFQRVATTFVTLLQFVMYVSFPLIILLSGFKASTAGKYLIMVFGVPFAAYFLTIGWVFKNVVIGTVMKMYHDLNVDSIQLDLYLMYLGNMVGFGLTILWFHALNKFIGIAGNWAGAMNSTADDMTQAAQFAKAFTSELKKPAGKAVKSQAKNASQFIKGNITSGFGAVRNNVGGFVSKNIQAGRSAYRNRGRNS